MESEWVIRTIRNTALEHNQNSDHYTAFYGREEAPQKPHLSFLLIVGEPGIVHVSGKSSNWGTKEWFQHVIIQSSKCRTRSTFHSDSPLSVIHAIFPAYFLQGSQPKVCFPLPKYLPQYPKRPLMPIGKHPNAIYSSTAFSLSSVSLLCFSCLSTSASFLKLAAPSVHLGNLFQHLIIYI